MSQTPETQNTTQTEVISTNVFEIKLAKDVQPKISIDTNKGYVKYGDKNDYPEQLLFWFNNHAEHGGIVKGKARYLSGSKTIPEQETPQAVEFLAKANAFEDWQSVRKKCELDKVISGGYFIQVISNVIGQPLQFFHLDFAKCRISDCYKYVLYSEDWGSKNHWRVGYISFPIWRPGLIGTSVYVSKNYSPGINKVQSTYSVPEYVSCTLDIDTDVRVTTFFNSLVSNNFSAGHIVTIFTGEQDTAKKKGIKDRLTGQQAGEDNAGKTVVIFTTKDGKASEVVSLNGNDLDKQYQEVTKRNREKILIGHNVPAVLFKQLTAGTLGQRNEMVEAHELFINEYVKIEQQVFNKTLSSFFKARYSQDMSFEVEQIQTIGLELPLDNQNVVAALDRVNPSIIPSYIIEKFGVKIPEGTTPGNVQQVNDALKGLSAQQNKDLIRIVRDFTKERINKAMAMTRLKSYGLSDKEALEWLGIEEIPVQQSAQSVKFLDLFDKYAHLIEEDEIIDIQPVKFSNHSELLRFERVRFKDYLKDPVKVSVTDFRNAILNEFKGNPGVKIEALVKKYKSDEKTIREAISYWTEKDFLKPSSEGYEPTEKGIRKETDNVETEIYTEYVYGLRPELKEKGEPVLLETSRDWCRDMVNRTKSKALTYESIVKMENDLGENAWDFRGGFYGDQPWCRHVWLAVTKIRRRKK